MDLNGTRGLITGGTRGIGAATARSLAERGADLVLVARRVDEEANQIAQQIRALGRRCELLSADLAKSQEVERSTQQAINLLGGLDILVHSAGGPVPGGILEVAPEQWQAAFDVHIHAIYHLCRAVVPGMKRQKRGAIVLISSTAGIRGVRSNIAYQVVKGAIPQFTRALAFELADDGIRVNCVAPGVVRTDFHASMSPETKRQNLEHRIPVHREGTPEQVANMIREMITNDYVTGETYVIDGGLTMRIA